MVGLERVSGFERFEGLYPVELPSGAIGWRELDGGGVVGCWRPEDKAAAQQTGLHCVQPPETDAEIQQRGG